MINNERESQEQSQDDAVPGRGIAAVDLWGWLERRREREPAPRSGPPRASGAGVIAAVPVGCESDGASTPARAAAYLQRLPPAVSGQGGHDRTFHAACVLIKGFGLSIDLARPVLEEWNRSCVPPWSPAELEHKLKSADTTPDDRPRGHLVGHHRKPRRGSYRGKPHAPSPAPARPAWAPRCEITADDSMVAVEGSESNPQRLAILFLSERCASAGGVGLRFWRDQFHRWESGVYRAISGAELRASIAQCLADEFGRLHRLAAAEADAQERGRPRRVGPIPVSTRLVGDVVQALTGLVLVRGESCAAQPAWLDAVPEAVARDPHWRRLKSAEDEKASQSDSESNSETSSAFADRRCDLSAWPARDLVPARNALVHPPSLVTGARCVMPPTPRFFNAHALDYDFDLGAASPKLWLEFLSRIWPDDEESVSSLQEWFGYLLTADTGLQKILMMIGPKRSGRGTIGRVLKALAGPSNVVNPTLATLARPFGLSVLIDKPVAIFPDARLSSRPDNALIVESLLSISGEDDQSIDRKHLPAWTGRLPTRFVLISNELPRLRDSSGALTGRLVILRFTRSFYNNEDATLFDRIRRELPGILLWALEGWRRLKLRGRFIQPESGRGLLESMDELTSPITLFLDDHCVVDPAATTPALTLYEAWRDWCRRHGRDAVGDEQALGRDLHAAIPGLAKSRLRSNGDRQIHYHGIRLRTLLDPDSS